jgi:hypothetical protein
VGIPTLLVLLPTTAHSKWDGPRTDEAQAAWFAAQHNKKSDWCCDKSDGHWYDSNYTFNPVVLRWRTATASSPTWCSTIPTLRGARSTGILSVAPTTALRRDAELMQPLALPRQATDCDRCHLCGDQLADRRIITRDERGAPGAFVPRVATRFGLTGKASSLQR